MKKIFISIIISLFLSQDYPILGSDTSLDILTWNIENYPKHSQTNIYLEDIITQINVDIIALQEIASQSDFNNLVSLLGPNWEGYRSASTNYGELSYLINTDRITINSIYTILEDDAYYFAWREPYVLEFEHQNIDYIMINNHFKCCGDDNLDLDDSGDEEYRRLMASILLEEFVDNNFNFQNVIILGDLNDNLTDPPIDNVFSVFLDQPDKYYFTDFLMAQESNFWEYWSYPTYPSHIDHILITDELFDDYSNEESSCSTIAIDQYIGGAWSVYDQYISDHRPVFLRLIHNPILGDVNNDDIVNILDVVIIVQMIIGNETQNNDGDFNEDGSVNVLDIVLLIEYIINN